jgi:hypothetical protein
MRALCPTPHCEDDIHSLYDDTIICNVNVRTSKTDSEDRFCAYRLLNRFALLSKSTDCSREVYKF